MVSLITRLILLLQLVVAGAVFLALYRYGGVSNPWLAAILGGIVVVVVRMIITANNFRLARRYCSETPPHCCLTWRQACRLYLEEFKSTMLSSSWTMPFRFFTFQPAHACTTLPVLLIHGYGCNSGYWHGMSKKLRAAKIAHRAVSLEPIFGEIESFVPSIQKAAEQLCAETGQDKIVIVAHSMGGLVARAYLCEHGSQKVAKVITLGTPHHGTGLAQFGIGKNSLQMRWLGTATEGTPGEWLKQFCCKENLADYALFVSIFSHHDNIIAPQTSSFLPGARNIALHGIGHVALGVNPRVQDMVISEILATPIGTTNTPGNQLPTSEQPASQPNA